MCSGILFHGIMFCRIQVERKFKFTVWQSILGIVLEWNCPWLYTTTGRYYGVCKGWECVTWGHVCHVMCHVWDFPTVGKVQQHACCSSAHAICLLIDSNSTNTKCFICRHNHTTARNIQQKIKCVLFRAFLSCKTQNIRRCIWRMT